MDKYKDKYKKLKKLIKNKQRGGSPELLDSYLFLLSKYYQVQDLTDEEISNLVQLTPIEYYKLMLTMYIKDESTEKSYNKPKNYIDFITDIIKNNIRIYSSCSPSYNHYVDNPTTLSLVTYNLYNNNCQYNAPLNDKIFDNKIIASQESYNKFISEAYEYILTNNVISKEDIYKKPIFISFGDSNLPSISSEKLLTYTLEPVS
jgi:hypothetical protein